MGGLDRLYIAATGMITPVGANSAMTAALVAAGVNAYQSSTLHNGYFAPITMTHVPEEGLPPLSQELNNQLSVNGRQARMLRLVEPALREALGGVKKNLALFMAGPGPLPGALLPIRSVFLRHMEIQTGISFDFDNSKVFPMGRAAPFFALEHAFNFLESSDQELALVGGVDTYWHPMTLGALAKDKRLRTANDDPDGFVAGEGAGFILLSKNQYSKSNRQVFRPGLAEELGHRYSEEPYKGDGLSLAFKQAVERANIDNITQIYSTFNGESFNSKEYGVTLTRNSSSMSENYEHLHPADCYGDLGAASGIILLSLASIRGKTPALCYGSSDDAWRGAACVI